MNREEGEYRALRHRGSPALRWHARLAVAVLVAATGSAGAGQQADVWIQRSPKLGVKRLVTPAHVTLEYPNKDWIVLPAGGFMLLSLAEKSGLALVQLERVRLNQPLTPDEVTDLFTELEARTIRDRHPDAKGFVSRVATVGKQRVVILQFDRVGTVGDERVRQYSVPVGDSLYRLVCAASTGQFARVEVVFAHMAASLLVEGSE
jgi:hypothetical protein